MVRGVHGQELDVSHEVSWIYSFLLDVNGRITIIDDQNNCYLGSVTVYALNKCGKVYS